MVKSCCVPKCVSFYGKQECISFYKVPSLRKNTTDNEIAQLGHKRRKLWLKNIGLDQFIDETKNLYVCSKHFISGNNCSE